MIISLTSGELLKVGKCDEEVVGGKRTTKLNEILPVISINF
jgi:hypothetical protein